ncbi:peptidase inhibitor I9 [Rhizoctonia solani AG-3 Rhs1AP]|uniref:Peptidase inhibitor I9 n=2 Tax=Rhizoctonia solani AG-3 TaxID=1086053 RepID=A0A074RD77_9AGAM|nr:peptidase inhibitor I9 [Rhizoctonia solani AG-3 Rhs1AP]KEP45136.1 peptidase inhibitor I9 [Rhizoctonia solani 123E]
MSTITISRPSQNAIPDKYIVSLKDHVDIASHLTWLQQRNPNPDDGSSKCEVIHKYKFIKGYAAKLAGPVLVDLTKCNDVKSIAQDRRPVR